MNYKILYIVCKLDRAREKQVAREPTSTARIKLSRTGIFDVSGICLFILYLGRQNVLLVLKMSYQ